MRAQENERRLADREGGLAFDELRDVAHGASERLHPRFARAWELTGHAAIDPHARERRDAAVFPGACAARSGGRRQLPTASATELLEDRLGGDAGLRVVFRRRETEAAPRTPSVRIAANDVARARRRPTGARGRLWRTPRTPNAPESKVDGSAAGPDRRRQTAQLRFRLFCTAVRRSRRRRRRASGPEPTAVPESTSAPQSAPVNPSTGAALQAVAATGPAEVLRVPLGL